MTYLAWCGEADAMIWDFLKWVVQLKLIAMSLLLCQTKSMIRIMQWESMSSWKDPSWRRTWDFAGPSANHDVYTSHTASKILHPQFYNMDTYKIPTSLEGRSWNPGSRSISVLQVAAEPPLTTWEGIVTATLATTATLTAFTCQWGIAQCLQGEHLLDVNMSNTKRAFRTKRPLTKMST